MQCTVHVYALAVHFWCLMHLYRRICDTFRMAAQNCCWWHTLKTPPVWLWWYAFPLSLNARMTLYWLQCYWSPATLHLTLTWRCLITGVCYVRRILFCLFCTTNCATLLTDGNQKSFTYDLASLQNASLPQASRSSGWETFSTGAIS